MNSSLEKTKIPNLRATYSNFFLIPIPLFGLEQIRNAQRLCPTHQIHWCIGSEAENSTILSDQRAKSCTKLCVDNLSGNPPLDDHNPARIFFVLPGRKRTCWARRPDWIVVLKAWGFDLAALGEEEPMHQGSNRTNSPPQNLKTPSRMRQFSTTKKKKKKWKSPIRDQIWSKMLLSQS